MKVSKYHWEERPDFHFRAITFVCEDTTKCGWVSQEPGATSEASWYWCAFIDTGGTHVRVTDGIVDTLEEAQEEVLRTHEISRIQ